MCFRQPAASSRALFALQKAERLLRFDGCAGRQGAQFGLLQSLGWKPSPWPRGPARYRIMIQRFVIAAIIVGLFLGGLAYFNLVFKPKMIGEFMAKMVPPPATVTAEVARVENWTDRMHAIGTLVAMEGVEVAPQVAGLVTEYFFERGDDVETGAKLVKLDTSYVDAE